MVDVDGLHSMQGLVGSVVPGITHCPSITHPKTTVCVHVPDPSHELLVQGSPWLSQGAPLARLTQPVAAIQESQRWHSLCGLISPLAYDTPLMLHCPAGRPQQCPDPSHAEFPSVEQVSPLGFGEYASFW